MKFEKFLGFGWRLSLPKIELVYALDAYGKYYYFRIPNYFTYIRSMP